MKNSSCARTFELFTKLCDKLSQTLTAILLNFNRLIYMFTSAPVGTRHHSKTAYDRYEIDQRLTS